MTTLFKYVQAQNFSLAGAGAIAGATSVIVKSFKAIDGVTDLTMTDFGAIGFATIEPGNGTQEEQISFTGVVQNANGTATLTGVKTVLFINPYTGTSGLAKTHPGSATLIITNTSGFYDQFPAKANDETITGQWTFSVFPITPANTPASTVALGVILTSVAPANPLLPIAVETTDPRVPVAYAVDSVGTDSYAITPSPAITAYAAGQHFTFLVGTANTGPATLAVNGLAAIPIVKNVNAALITGDILANQVVEVVYDGTNMQLLSASYQFASTTQVGIVEEATQAEVDAGTAAGGTGARLFMNPSTPSSFTIGAGIPTMVKTYFNVQLLFMRWQGDDTGGTTDEANWVFTSGSSAAVEFKAGGAFANATGTGADGFYLALVSGLSPFVITNTGGALRWSSTNIIIMDWWAIMPASATGDINMGFFDSEAGMIAAYNDSTDDKVMFARSAAGALYATIAKAGTGVTNTDISSGITLTAWNNYRIELDLSNNALFYVNGVLKATLSGANLPSTTDYVTIGFGRSNDANYVVTAPNISMQMNP